MLHSTSVVGLKLETYGTYAATKAAVETLTVILSKELRGRSITVNALRQVRPLLIFPNGKSQELIDRMAKRNALERLGLPKISLPSLLSSLGTDGSWINGRQWGMV